MVETNIAFDRCLRPDRCKYVKGGGNCAASLDFKGKPRAITEVYTCPRGKIQDGKFIPKKGAK